MDRQTSLKVKSQDLAAVRVKQRQEKDDRSDSSNSSGGSGGSGTGIPPSRYRGRADGGGSGGGGRSNNDSETGEVTINPMEERKRREKEEFLTGRREARPAAAKQGAKP
ncbi:hypothetical protein Bca101_061410 [Brassica carinata]